MHEAFDLVPVVPEVPPESILVVIGTNLGRFVTRVLSGWSWVVLVAPELIGFAISKGATEK